MSTQKRAWSKMWAQPLESLYKQLPFKSYVFFRFGGRHLESVVSNVGRHRRRHGQVGRGRKCGGSRWHNVCMLLETEVTSTSRIPPIFPWRVPLVFQVHTMVNWFFFTLNNITNSHRSPVSQRRRPTEEGIRSGKRGIMEVQCCLTAIVR